MGRNLFNKVWDLHRVKTLDSGLDQLFIGLHLIHEVTSPQAFSMIKERRLKVRYPERTYATVDHIVPTLNQSRPFEDELAEKMMLALEENTVSNGISLFDADNENQGIVHIIGPELGLTRPGMTIACGDSHTSTHGAFGSIALGVGTSQIRDILATQTIAVSKPKVRRIQVTGKPGPGVTAKDIILKIISELGVNGGIGYAYEYAGPAIRALSMEERMTICNMSIEGGARVGYVNPDETTFEYLRGRRFAPEGEAFDKAVEYWKRIASDEDAEYDDVYSLDISSLSPMVTWGINPGQAVSIDDNLPRLTDLDEGSADVAAKAYEHMGFQEGSQILGMPVDVVFIGSCTNGRISDLRAAAAVVEGRKLAEGVRGLVVPGSKHVAMQAEREGLPGVFISAGFEWRNAGCSMCLAMNPDKLKGRELCASSSNRNFIGRQGSPEGRTMLMSPQMAAAAAVSGKIVDVRELMGGEK
ncbi:MAG: 3-isopropylmalate dehydratase large subunit [Spirochaetales bacterium]|uniref:3-isopropylmalate dehydratase large subunit n=1 Tax=Candidatus Thalassospirochaeta sargassi TaxID=3119039 RepID=A0AAJ1IE95_9SPIO|nr:3-isopropylmalate dehydratase large subunit [Spirochaetales bacterium]